ncbi:MAG: BON domain-containing protein [Gammaproteobacteria bacterium]|jgi:osmotically-inducible protein OsmY|nr:MAG: BON domain-containing protein [Gammaproteobacteria bacterium]HDN68980.1 BON domain-containing protein [Gammaproteobacteria bacterium]
MKSIRMLLMVILTANLLGGCAAVIVGGAAVGASAVHERRSVGTMIDDEGIEWKVRSALNGDKNLSSQSHISVISVNEVVLLVGQTPTEAFRQQAGVLAKGVDKVRIVHNELTVAAPSTYMTRTSDSYITSKVKTSLFKVKGHDDFDPTRVKVVTENGTVYLMGILYRSEAEDAAKQASRVGGVQKVVKLFEYLD